VQDVLVGEAYGKELGLGHYKIVSTVSAQTNPGAADQRLCKL
jgi:branched-chain amino acid transport system substrate-binding protein